MAPPPVAALGRPAELLVGAVAAGPPDVELPPADEPPLCANAGAATSISAVATEADFKFMIIFLLIFHAARPRPPTTANLAGAGYVPIWRKS